MVQTINFYLFGTHQIAQENDYNYLLYLISFHSQYKLRINKYLQFLPSPLTSQSIIKMGTLINAFLYPEFPSRYHRKLATQLLQSLQINIDHHTATITYTNLSQYLLKIASSAIENIDLKSTLAFLEMLIHRITDSFIVNIQDDKNRQKIQTVVKLTIFNSQRVLQQCELPEKIHNQEVKKVYYSEHVTQRLPQQISANQLLVRQLKKKPQQVIPLGYVCQDFLQCLINSSFEVKSTYRLKTCKKVQIGEQDRIDYYAEIQNDSIIRDKVVNKEIFSTCFLMGNDILGQIVGPGKDLTMYRTNIAIAKLNYYQKLKLNKSGQHNYINILSQYFERDQFQIDELQLTRQKLIQRRKQHLLGISGKQTIKKQQKDFDDEARLLGLRIYQDIQKYLDKSRLQTNIKALSVNLRNILDQDKNINILLEKNLSKNQNLARDSNNPFSQDIINYAKMNPLQLLIIGRAKSGKSALAKATAKKFKLIHISIQSMIEKLFERVKFFEQNPPQVDDDGNAKDGLLPIQKVVLQELNGAKNVNNQDMLDLINNQIIKQATINQGFILDLPFQYDKFWSSAIISHRIQLPKLNCRFFTHIIQIQQTEEQWKYHNQGIMQKPQQVTTSSKYDRYLITKPKPPVQQGQEEPPQQQQKPAPLIETALIKSGWKQSNSVVIDHLSQHIHPNNLIKINNSYQNVEQSLKIIQSYLYILPLAKKIEGAQKQLLGVGLEEQKIFRKWSAWGLVDSVQLYNDKLIMGKFQFAAQYAGRVFVFENQNNLNAFLSIPRKYLQTPPKIPSKTNICVVGPRKSGKKTIAKILADIYKFHIIDIESMLLKVLNRQKSFENHIPSNPEKRSTSVHLSQGQFKQFSKGNSINAKDILPMILWELGIALQKKPPGWGIEKGDEDGENKQQGQQQKKPAPKKAKKKQKGDDERPKTPPLEDLSLKQMIPQINYLGKLNEIKGFIIVGYPNNEQQLNSLKSFNIPIDKMVILSDSNEEAPNKILGQRLNDAELQQVAMFTGAIGPVKQALTQEAAKQFQIDKTAQQIVNKIRQFIDPFYLKSDQDSINRVIADKQQQGDPIPLGFCGDYCPVALQSGWLIKGKQQFQAGIQGKRFRFSGQKQLNLFKQNPKKYIICNEKKKTIPPRIMFMGLRGVGLKTQLIKLNQKYKVPILSLKDTLLQHIENQKQKRKTQRYYNKGFKIPEFDQQGKQVQDAELNEEHPEFDKRGNEIDITKNIFQGIEQIFINGNFFEVDEQKVSTGVVQLLSQARKLPEVVLILTSDQGKWLQRVMDKKAIEQQLEQIKQKRRQQKAKQRQQARQKAIQNGQQYQQPAQQQQDPQIPKLEDMITQKQQSLKAQRQADSAKLQQFTQAFKALNIEVINIKCQRGPKHVNDRINHVLKPYLEDRFNINWQKNDMLPIERHRVPDFLNSFIVKDSRFGKLNPFSLMKPFYSYPLIYKDRIYYLQDEEQRDRVIKNYKLLETNLSVPLDVKIIPSAFVVGKTKTGRTCLADAISKKLGLIKIDIKDIIDNFCQDHKDYDIECVLKDLRSGKPLTDQNIVMLIQKRVSIDDCQSNGWILDGFPNNIKQCQLLNKKGLSPMNVFSIQLSDFQIKRRIINANKNDLYDWDLEVIHERLQKNRKNLLQVDAYYINKFNNLIKIDGHLSKWGIFEAAKSQIQCTVKNRREFARSLVTHTPASASKSGITFNCVINNLADYSTYCPTSYKIKRQYNIQCPKHHKWLCIFNKKIYLLASQKQLKDFMLNPQTYINKGNLFNPLAQLSAVQVPSIVEKIECKAYCMVQLTRKKLVKGSHQYTVKYKGKYYCMVNPINMKLFIKNPALYQMATLQDKLPVQFERKSDLKKIAKKNDCTAFLQHHLSNILMRSLAQLGYRRPKYPTLGSKESALKFLAISLKATNPNKDQEYRQKYTQKLNQFIKDSCYSQQIREQLDRKEKQADAWQAYDEQNLLKLCEEYNQFLNQMQKTDKNSYFSQFIR